MKREKVHLYLAGLFIIGIPIIGFGLDFLSSVLKIPNLEFLDIGILVLYLLFLDGVFANKASEKTYWQIVSYTNKDKVIFILSISGICILSSVYGLLPKSVYKLPVFLITLFLVIRLSLACFSPQVQKELKEKS